LRPITAFDEGCKMLKLFLFYMQPRSKRVAKVVKLFSGWNYSYFFSRRIITPKIILRAAFYLRAFDKSYFLFHVYSQSKANDGSHSSR